MTYYEVSVQKHGKAECERQVLSTPDCQRALLEYKNRVAEAARSLYGRIIRFRAVTYHTDGDVSMKLVRRIEA